MREIARTNRVDLNRSPPGPLTLFPPKKSSSSVEQEPLLPLWIDPKKADQIEQPELATEPVLNEASLSAFTAFLCSFFEIPLSCFRIFSAKKADGTSTAAFNYVCTYFEQVLLPGEILVSEDLAFDARFPHSDSCRPEEGIRFFVAFPLRTAGIDVGFLFLGATKPRPDLAYFAVHFAKECAEVLSSMVQTSTDTPFTLDLTQANPSSTSTWAVLQARYPLATHLGDNGILDWDRKTNEVYLSKQLAEILGYPDGEHVVSCSSLLARFHPKDLASMRPKFVKLVRRREHEFSMDVRVQQQHGWWRWIQVQGFLTYSKEGHVKRLLGSVRRRAKDHSLNSVTFLPDRVAFSKALVKRGKADQEGLFCVLCVGVNSLRTIHTSFGQDAHHRVLQQTAQRLESVVLAGTENYLAHVGEEVFAVLLSSAEADETGVEYALQLHDCVSECIQWGDATLTPSASVGISVGGIDQADRLLENAEIAMYEARAKGNFPYVVFAEETRALTKRRMELEGELRNAIDREELMLQYQPQIKLDTGRLVGFEALVRWRHPQRGIVSPAEFIHCAEESGLILKIGRWVLSQAIHELKSWQSTGLLDPDITISVNLSAKQFHDLKLLEFVKAVLEGERLSPSSLSLEITESVFMDDEVKAMQVMSGLRSLGVNLELDDFGTGYSSLSSLHRFPFTTLKLDQRFVRNLEDNQQSEAIARSIFQLAETLKMKVIAEGIETPKQVAILRAMGCQYGQGYLYARPLSAPDIPIFLEG